MWTRITPDQLAPFLQEEGYKAKVEVDGDGDACIRSGSNGYNWSVYFDDRSELGTRLSFTLGYWVPGDVEVDAICNSYNRQNVIGQMWHSLEPDKDGDWMVVLQLHLSLIGGVTDEWIISSIERWDLAVVEFLSLIRPND